LLCHPRPLRRSAKRGDVAARRRVRCRAGTVRTSVFPFLRCKALFSALIDAAVSGCCALCAYLLRPNRQRRREGGSPECLRQPTAHTALLRWAAATLPDCAAPQRWPSLCQSPPTSINDLGPDVHKRNARLIFYLFAFIYFLSLRKKRNSDSVSVFPMKLKSLVVLLLFIAVAGVAFAEYAETVDGEAVW